MFEKNFLSLRIHRLALSGSSILAAILISGSVIAGQALAQTALDSAEASQETSPSGLRVSKVSKGVGFAITVTNSSDKPVAGAVVTEKVGKGLLCPAENPVTFTGNGAPNGSFTLADLIQSGITLNTLMSGQSVVLFYSCQAS